MLKRPVCCALSLFENPARIVVLVATLEPKVVVRSGDFRTGKTSRIIQYVTNRFSKFAVLTGCYSHCLMLCSIEIVDSA